MNTEFKKLSSSKVFGDDYQTKRQEIQDEIEVVVRSGLTEAKYAKCVIAAAQTGLTVILEQLIECDAYWKDIESRDANKAFDRAAYNGKLSSLKMLFEHGVSGTAMALEYACKFGFEKVVVFLLEEVGTRKTLWCLTNARNRARKCKVIDETSSGWNKYQKAQRILQMVK